MSTKIHWLDGGFLFEMNKLYGDLGQQISIDNQDIVYNLYQSYIQLGCSYITTNNYGFKPSRCKNWKELCQKSAAVFIRLKQTYPKIVILGSLPPFFPSYTYEPVNKEFKQYYRELISILNSYVDEYIIETSVSIEHNNCICQIINDLTIEKPINISFYPDKINSDDICTMITKHKMIHKLLVNCCSFDDMYTFYNDTIQSVLNKYKNIQFGFYLNKIHEKQYTTEQIVEDLQSYKHDKCDNNRIKEFINIFLDITIGGCCGYGVEEMKELMNELKI